MKRLISLLLALAMVLSLPVGTGASSFKYVDRFGELTLQIPSGWDLSTRDDSVRLESDDSKIPVIYRSEDLWDSLSRSEQNSTPREEFNNDIMSKADVADILEARTKDVSYVVFNGVEYFQVTTTATKGVFLFKTKTTTTTLIHFRNGIMYLFQFDADTDHKDFPLFEDLICGVTFDEEQEEAPPAETQPPETVPETTVPVRTEADIYREAQEAYNKGRISEAEELFTCVPDYEDAQDYLRLIRIRDYGSNTGIGCVYSFSKGLMDFQKAEIDKAAKRFYFADTAEVLLCNTDVACYYLFGNWITPAGSPAYAYFKLHKDSVGGYYYTRSSNLSNAVSDCVSIIDGDVRISITSSNTLVFHIDLTAPDCMEIYSYETCKTFTLQRS